MSTYFYIDLRKFQVRFQFNVTTGCAMYIFLERRRREIYFLYISFVFYYHLNLTKPMQNLFTRPMLATECEITQRLLHLCLHLVCMFYLPFARCLRFYVTFGYFFSNAVNKRDCFL